MIKAIMTNSQGSPLMALPILGILAYLDYEANDGQTVKAALSMFQQARTMELAPAAIDGGKQMITVAVLGVIAFVIFSVTRGSATFQSALTVASATRKTSRMPSTMPRRLVEVVGEVLTVRGGNQDGLPLFWLDGKGSTVTPLAWTLAVEYANGTEPDKVSKFIPDIENRLYGAGYDVQVRVADRPLSLTIDNPQPPVFSLRDYWKHIEALPQDERLCAPAVEPTVRGMQLVTLSLRNMGAGTLVAGMPGAGKTQFVLSAVLSLCMANSPQRVSLIIADVKAADTMPLSGLPHLAIPVVTDVAQIADVLDALVAEMTARMTRAAGGDRAWMQHSICVVVDELAELIIGNKRGDAIASNVQRLSQAGRGMGIILLVATQRVFDIPAKVYSKLDRRCVFRVASAGDSVAASGSEGTRCNKLPKRGALEIFSAGDPNAQRAQGLFVADAESADYEAMLHGYVADVCARWGNVAPGWVYAPFTMQSASVQDDEGNVRPPMPTPAIAPGTVEALCAKYGDPFVDALVALGDEDKLTARAVGRVHEQMFGKQLNNETRRSIREIIYRDCID
jgi:hypothetical protein